MRKLNLIKIIVIVLVFALLARLIYKKYINNESKIQVPVLLYHHFLTPIKKATKNKFLRALYIQPSNIANNLKAVSKV